MKTKNTIEFIIYDDEKQLLNDILETTEMLSWNEDYHYNISKEGCYKRVRIFMEEIPEKLVKVFHLLDKERRIKLENI